MGSSEDFSVYNVVVSEPSEGMPLVRLIGPKSHWTGPDKAGITARKVKLDSRFTRTAPLLNEDRISLQLTEDLSVNAEVSESFSNCNNTISTTAKIEGTQWGRIFLANSNGIVTGRVRLPDQNRIFSIEYNHADKLQYLLELDPALAEPDEGADQVVVADVVEETEQESLIPFEEAPVLEDESLQWAVIDVIVVYSDDALAAAGSQEAMDNRIALGASYANDAYENSLVYMRWNVVHSYMLNYAETGSNLSDLNAIKADSSVASMRNTYGADFVQFINNSGSGGIASLLMYQTGSSSVAYSVVDDNSYSSYTPVHEAGHNMGCSHAPDQNYQAGPTTWYEEDTYSFGSCAAGHHWHPTPAATGRCSVMTYTSGTYFADGLSHARVGLFSNPDINDSGLPSGVYATADNARVMRTLRHIYAAYRSVDIGENIIKVNYPAGGEALIAGNTYSIMWDPRNVTGNVKVELLKSGVLNSVIAADTANDRMYSWTVPALSGKDFTIRVTSLSEAIVGVSYSDFRISQVFYNEPLDDDPNYTTTGEWEFGAPAASNATYYGPSTAYTGTNIYDTDLDATSGTTGHLTSTPIDCRGYHGVKLSFFSQLATWTDDTAVFSVSNNNVDWTELHSESSLTYSWNEYTYDISAVADNQQTVYIRWSLIGGSEGNTSGISIDDITLSGFLGSDPVISISNGLLTAECFQGLTPANHSFGVKNVGLGTLDYSISTDQTWLSVSPTSGTSAGEEDSITVTYDATALTPGDYTANITVADPAAETTSRIISVSLTVKPLPAGMASLPYSESFEVGLGAWTQETDDDMNWTRDSGATPSSGTGPSGAQDGSYYMFTEASPVASGDDAELTCWFDLRNVGAPELKFYYHMYGADMGTLDVTASTGGSWASLWSLSGNQGDSWSPVTVDLSAYAGQVVQLKFTGVRGTQYTSDVAIDLVTLEGNPATHTVTFDLDGKGTLAGGGALIQVVDYNTAATAPMVTNNSGWYFTGWDRTFANVVGDITVTALYNVSTAGDVDGDSLPDTWEQAIVDADDSDSLTTVGEIQGTDDYDEDGISNAQEYANGLDPTVFDIVMRSGWNLLHYPRTLTIGENDLDLRFASKSGSVWTWDTASGSYSTVTSLTPGTANWVYWQGESTIQMPGAKEGTQQIEVNPGWNMVGTLYRAQKMSSVNITENIWYWDAAVQNYQQLSANIMQPGTGYWVYSLATETFDLVAE